MFNKKCPKCARKISRDFEFCPYCGYNIKREENERNYGFLGKDDSLNLQNIAMPMGFDKIFSSLLKQIDSQFKNIDKEFGKELKDIRQDKKLPFMSKGISISISTSSDKKPEIKIKGFGPGFENIGEEIKKEEKLIELKMPSITEEKARKLSKLPKKEAETKVRRLSNKVVYEISMPGVDNLDNITINKLENSIEIKAFAKDKAYFKLLPINLPILNYKLEDEKLLLELKAK